MGEFDLIARYFQRDAPNTVLGIGDDAALVLPRPGQQLAVAADTMVEGRHFFAGTDPYSLGWKVLAVNLSDMAAMGAVPRWFTLCLTLPQADASWLAEFSRGLFSLARRFDIDLIGGDTTRGPLAFSVQILGEVAPDAALRRSGAQVGDDVWLSGTTGYAALMVGQRSGWLVLAQEDATRCAPYLDRPEPRIALGLALRGLATAAIDVSDGLVADLGHIAQQSGLSACIHLDQLALPTLQSPPSSDIVLAAALTGGDDYELCFTASPERRDAIAALALALPLPVQRIGSMQLGAGVAVLDANQQRISLDHTGFNHFA